MGRAVVALPLSLFVMLDLSVTTHSVAQQGANPPMQASLTTSSPTLVGPKGTQRSWEQFEAEFGLQQNDPTLIRGNLRRVKYGMDLVTYSVDNFLRSTERALELKYSNGAVRRAATAPNEPSPGSKHAGAFDDTRLKLDLDLTRGKPYVGLRLVVPFGN